MKYILFVFLLIFSGCASKALNYEPQALNTDYNATWQYNLNISELDTLIAAALKNNDELGTAALNLQIAMLRAGVSLNDLFPTPSASFEASSSKDISTASPSSRNFSSGVALSWELDLFGRLYKAYQSSDMSALASSLNLNELRIVIVNSVISQYFSILYLNESKANLEKNYENMLLLHALIEQKVNLGKEEPLALAQSRQNLLNLQNSLNATQKELESAYESLKNLTRIELKPSGKISDTALPSYELGLVRNGDEIITFSWLERIKNRPDVNAALAALNAGFYDYESSQLDFLPRISLSGGLNDRDEKANKAFGFNLLSGNVRITLPFLDFFRLRSNLKISQAEFEKLRIAYEKALNNALNETIKFAAFCELGELSLANNENIVNEREKILAIYEQKYNAGRSEFRDLLNASNDLLSARNSKANSKYQLLTAIIGFLKSSAY